MTLSRKAIRPLQTAFLLAHGVLPISIDYRLCPETNLIDGPITDVCDAYAWVQTKLQAVVKTRGISVDEKRIVVIGWSTGGHLAMTTAWTSKEAGLRPPVAILSFYGPTDFESGGESTQSLQFFSLQAQYRYSVVILFGVVLHCFLLCCIVLYCFILYCFLKLEGMRGINLKF